MTSYFRSRHILAQPSKRPSKGLTRWQIQSLFIFRVFRTICLVFCKHATPTRCFVVFFGLSFFKETTFDILSPDASKHRRNGIPKILNSVN